MVNALIPFVTQKSWAWTGKADGAVSRAIMKLAFARELNEQFIWEIRRRITSRFTSSANHEALAQIRDAIRTW